MTAQMTQQRATTDAAMCQCPVKRTFIAPGEFFKSCLEMIADPAKDRSAALGAEPSSAALRAARR